MNCPEDEQLKVFLDGRLPEEVCLKFEKHLQNCFTCQARLPQLNHATSSIVTSIQLTDDSQFEFLDEPECAELQAFANNLPNREQHQHQQTTIVVDPSDINTGIPKSIGRYQVIRHIGAGSFGAVYLARDAHLDRHVAIKVAHPTRVTTPADAERYQREAKLLAKMEHPNIVPVHDSGLTEDGLVYIVFRFIRGSNLAEMMEPERFPVEKVVELTCTIAAALHYMHSHGIVHRDIKPANVLIDQEGIPYLTDFGLAIRADDIVQGREIVGTLAYMSPEQLSGDGHLVGPRSDIFSLGVLLFELLTGQRPFHNRQPERSITWMGDAPSPCDFEKSLPLSIGRICQKALQNRSSDRFSTAREFARELQAAVDDTLETSEESNAKPVYRGLRAFHREDQEFFCELLPGLRSSQGNPESVQFWINRIRGIDGEYQPRIGVIYGNTGSGKSSLVNAAITPKLTDEITIISIQASASRTEIDLANGLKKVFLASEEIDSLPEICRHIRMRQPPFANQRVLIVIDQFEQWLHGRTIDLTVELVQALRQCDGESIQCLLIVRDDFWVELSKFMRTVEEPMREGENMMAVEPFSLEHAESVLQKIGQAVKGVPPDESTRRSFIQRGVQLIQTEGSVPPVRLALFVEITKDLPWEAETIRHFDDLTILAQTYIKQRFDPELCPRRFRTHTTAMKAVLAALLPERGNDLKGQGRSLQELKTLCGYENSPERFKHMIDLMDRDLRIISPVQRSEEEAPNELSYQLTHDYLVPAIRSWIDEEELRTYQGRAKLKLKERASLWSLKREFRQLPGLLEVLHISTGTKSSQWTADQTRLMKSASKYLAVQALGIAAILVMLSSFLYYRSQTNADRSLISELTKSSYANVPELLEQIEKHRPRIQTLLIQSDQELPANSPKRTRIALAKLSFDQSVADQLKEHLLEAEVEEFRVIADEFIKHEVDVSEFSSIIEQEEIASKKKFRAAMMLLATVPEEQIDDLVIELVASGVVKQTRTTLPQWSEWLSPYREQIIPHLHQIYQSQTSSEIPEHAALLLADYLIDHPVKYTDLILTANDQQLLILCNNANGKSQASIDKISDQLLTQISKLTKDQISRKINCISALGHLGKMNVVANYFKHSDNPSLRYLVIGKLATSRCDPLNTISLLRHSEHEEVIAALLLNLGSYDQAIFNDSMQDEIRDIALTLFQTHIDSEVHSASQWVLNRFGETPTLPSSTIESETVREWSVGPSGFTMISPTFEHRHLSNLSGTGEFELNVDWEFSISSTEVTVHQYSQFDPEYRINRDLHSSQSCPVSRVNFESAMRYCNWLSRQEGLQDEDLCYEEQDQRARPKENFLECKGYRLPMEDEWEVATRAGTVTPFPFGAGVDVLDQFAWHAIIADSRVHPVGNLMPNQLGLFDVCGNVSEWCHNPASLERNSKKWASNSSVPYRGGSFKSFTTSQRPFGDMTSEDSPESSRDAAVSQTGFRIARTVRNSTNIDVND